MKNLNYTVFPSIVKTIFVEEDDIYGGAHDYNIYLCSGFQNDDTTYLQWGNINIPFVKREEDGSFTPGVQSEQLVYVLLDRAIKLNNRFPSIHNEKMIERLSMFLEACEDRIKDRIGRNIMGELKN